MKLWLFALLALTGLRLLLCAALPLTADEAYYAIWAHHLQAGYYDDPPMVAYWIRAGTMLFGNTPFGIRCLAPLAGAVGSIMLWYTAETMFSSRKAGITAALLLNATLLVGVGALIMTPDTPLIFFWVMGLAALAKLIASGNKYWWLAVGAASGFALLSKYTAAFLVIGIFLWLITSKERRPQLTTLSPWLGVATALLIFVPNIIWNAEHQWVSVFKQGGRLFGFDPARSVQFFFELIIGQFFLFTPIIAVLGAVAFWRMRKMPMPQISLLVWLTIIPVAVFLEHVLHDRVQSNWVAVIYPAVCLIAAALPAAILSRWLRPAIALGFAFSAVAYLQVWAAPFPLPAKIDPTALQMAGWQNFAEQAMAGHPAYITSDDYATTAILSYYGRRDVEVVGFNRRNGDYRYRYLGAKPADLLDVKGVLVTRRTDTDCPVLLGTVTRTRNGEPVTVYRLCQFVAHMNGVILPRP